MHLPSKAAIIGAALLLSPFTVLAHGSGQHWTKDTGAYTIEVTADTPAIAPGQPVHFDFGLSTKTLDSYNEPVGAEFSLVQIALMDGDETVLTKNLPASKDRGFTVFNYTFPEKSADYTLAVRYLQDGRELAAGSFPVAVGAGTSALPSPLLAAMTFAAGGAALALGIAISRTKKPAHSRR